jgi:hypothetical protein
VGRYFGDVESAEPSRDLVSADQLRSEIEQMRADMKREIEERNQALIDNRTRPPLASMTRLQKRYFLEPWWTAIWATGWGTAAALFMASIWLPFTLKLALTGVACFVVGGVAMIAKLTLAEWNGRTEGVVTQQKPRRDSDFW